MGAAPGFFLCLSAIHNKLLWVTVFPTEQHAVILSMFLFSETSGLWVNIKR